MAEERCLEQQLLTNLPLFAMQVYTCGRSPEDLQAALTACGAQNLSVQVGSAEHRGSILFAQDLHLATENPKQGCVADLATEAGLQKLVAEVSPFKLSALTLTVTLTQTVR